MLDWSSKHDPRSLNYPLPTSRTRKGYRFWNEGPTLDQGQDGYCVGFGWTGELLAEPIVAGKSTFDFAAALFHLALKYDDIPGEADDTGTSVLAGAKAAQKLGFINEYRWCFSIDEVARAIYNHGPVVIGIPWLDSMFKPQYLPGHDAETPDQGLAKAPNYPVLDCTGNEVGGHCLLVTGFTRFGNTEYFRLKNSWGNGWGLNGDAMITRHNLAQLLHGTGEACIAFDVPQSQTLQPTPYGMEYLPAISGM
jgi:hypothetical protein